MRTEIIVTLGIRNAAILCSYIVYLYNFIKYKNVARVLFKIKDERDGKAITLCVGILLIYIFFTFTIPSVKDIPYIVRDEYIELEGIAESNSKQNSNGRVRSVRINANEETVRVVICGNCKDISIGDELEVKYLPNTHYCYVVEHKTISD